MNTHTDIVTLADRTINCTAGEVLLPDGTSRRLNATSLALLSALGNRPGICVSNEVLWEANGNTSYSKIRDPDRTIRGWIKVLRASLGDDDKTLVRNQHGKGYMLTAPLVRQLPARLTDPDYIEVHIQSEAWPAMTEMTQVRRDDKPLRVTAHIRERLRDHEGFRRDAERIVGLRLEHQGTSLSDRLSFERQGVESGDILVLVTRFESGIGRFSRIDEHRNSDGTPVDQAAFREALGAALTSLRIPPKGA